MNCKESFNYFILGTLIEDPSSERLSLELKSSELKNKFIDFCKRKEISSFLYSILSEQVFENLFLDEMDSFSKEYQKLWASSLRFDGIRQELRNTILDVSGVEPVFLDDSFRSRLKAGNKGLRINDSIQILIPREVSIKKVFQALRPIGFLSIVPDKRNVARIYKKFNADPHIFYFRRNDFFVTVSHVLPSMFYYGMDSEGVISRCETFNGFQVLSSVDSLIFSLFSLLEKNILGIDCFDSMLSSYLLGMENALGGLPVEDKLLREACYSKLKDTRLVFSGRSCGFGPRFAIGRVFLLLKCKPRIGLRDFYRTIFKIRYL